MASKFTGYDLVVFVLFICVLVCLMLAGIFLQAEYSKAKPPIQLSVERLPELSIADSESFCAREVTAMVDRDKSLVEAGEKSVRLSGNLPPTGYYHAYGFHYDEPTADKILPPHKEWPLMAFWSKRSEASGRWYYSALFKSR